MFFRTGLTVLASLLVATVSLADPVEITQCGQVVSADAVMTADLLCDGGGFEEVAVNLAAPDITLDLGGHTISGQPLGIGIRAMNVDGVTIRNGIIENFLSGIDIVNTVGTSVTDMTIRNLQADNPDDFLMAMRINDSRNAVVKDSLFEYLPIAHKNGIHVANSEVIIDNIVMVNGGVGVDISGDCSVSPRGSSGSIINSRFVGVTIAGVLVQCTENARVAGNEFDRNEMGILVDTHQPGLITGLVVADNYIHDGYIGIHFMGNTDSEVLRNVIHNNGWRGVYLDSNMGCPDEPTPDCFFAHGNVIAGNRVFGSFIDMHHHVLADGNTWTDNQCGSCEGTEIPACTAIHIDGFESYPHAVQ